MSNSETSQTPLETEIVIPDESDAKFTEPESILVPEPEPMPDPESEPVLGAVLETVSELDKRVAPRSASKRKQDTKDYQNVFFARKASERRKQTYISVRILDSMNHFLPVIAKDISVTAYIDNILSEHLEQYQDELNEQYLNAFSKPFKHEKNNKN